MSITPYLDAFDAEPETKRVLAVHLEIARRRGPIVAARRGDGFQGIAADILVERRVGQKADPGSAADHHATPDEIFCRHSADEALRKRLRLCHEAPMPGSDHPTLRDVRPHMII